MHTEFYVVLNRGEGRRPAAWYIVGGINSTGQPRTGIEVIGATVWETRIINAYCVSCLQNW